MGIVLGNFLVAFDRPAFVPAFLGSFAFIIEVKGLPLVLDGRDNFFEVILALFEELEGVEANIGIQWGGGQ